MKNTDKNYTFCVIGNPVSHSLSPVIHNTLFDYYKMDNLFGIVFVTETELSEFSYYAKKSLLGACVTMPYKEKIIPLCDVVDDEAKRYNSVNILNVKNGNIYGHNTDALGYLSALNEINFEVRGKTIAVLGSGAFCRSALVRLSLENPHCIKLFARSNDAREQIRDIISQNSNCKVELFDFDAIYQHPEQSLTDVDLLINTTPIGMNGFDNFLSYDFINALPKKAIVSEIAYNPLYTTLLQHSKARGLATLDGLSLLLHQGLLAFEIWTGIFPCKEAIKAVRVKLIL